jgi:outer membrane biosynthesis protein TonB
MEAPPKFLEGLEKYFAGNLEGAREFLTGDDLLSKALLVLVDVKLDDGTKNAEIQSRIDAMDFKGNDIALMFCVLAQEYGLHMAKAHNLLLKRFGKEEKVIKTESEEEMPELEPVDGSKKPETEKAETEKAETKEPEATVKPEVKEPEVKEPEVNVKPEATVKPEVKEPEVKEPEVNVKPEAKKSEANVTKAPKQVGGKRVTRKPSSKSSGKKRVSRGKA